MDELVAVRRDERVSIEDKRIGKPMIVCSRPLKIADAVRLYTHLSNTQSSVGRDLFVVVSGNEGHVVKRRVMPYDRLLHLDGFYCIGEGKI